MFDSRKIDAFFNGDKPFDNDKADDKPQKSAWLRFVKLGFPCIAAALFGVMVVMPNIKKNIEIQSDITVPRKNELEKLHIEKTVFNATDAKNRVNTITADSADEVEPGSSEIKINNPKGHIPTDKGEVVISSQIGYFDQQKNILTLQDKVHAVIDEETVIDTQKATYEFEKEYGFGTERVNVIGTWGTVDAGGFEYFKQDNILVLTGHTVIATKNGILTSEKETRWFQDENKSVSEGDVVIHQGQNILKADKVISYFEKGDKTEIKRVEAYGNVRVLTPKGTAKGEKGFYNPKTALVELVGQVQVEQDGNFINGSRAETNLNTSVSRILADKKKGERITGTFYNKRKAKDGKSGM